MSAPLYHQIDIKIGTAAAGANEVARYVNNTRPTKLFTESVCFVPDTAVTAADANSGTITVKIGATTISTLTTNLAQGDLVAGTRYALTLSASGADLEVDSLESVSVTKTYTGSGAVMSGVVSFSVTEIRS
jgi:hypothetical protein